MAWTTPGTATTGDVLTASQWNTDVRDNPSFLYGPPRCRVHRDSTQTISTASETAIAFNVAAEYDTDSMHDSVTNNTRITFTTAGVYAVGGLLAVDVTIGFGIQGKIRKNGTTAVVTNRDARTATSEYLMLATVAEFSAADYIELMAYHEQTADRTFSTVDDAPVMYATWVGGPA